MGKYVVQLSGGGSMEVNASSPQAAADNVRSTGNTPAGDSGGGSSSSGGGGGGGGGGSSQYGSNQGYWSTSNGPRTVPQMAAELAAVGYGGPTDPGSVMTAYAHTTGGQVTADNTNNTPGGAGPTSDTPTASNSGGLTSTSPGGQQIYNKDAQAAAEANANQQAVNAYNSARLALDGAHYANMDQNAKDQLAFQQATQAYNESITNAGLTGTFNGAPTQAAIAQQAGLTGVYNGQPTEAARQFNVTANQNAIAEQDKTTQGYLNLLSGLRGPNDPFQYLRTLQGTPNGMADIVNAAAGRYQLGGTASGAIAPRATIQGQIDNMNNAQPGGSNSQDPNVQGLPPASQIDTRAFNQMLPSQQAALWAAYQYGGPSGAMNIPDAQAMFKQSMPDYGGPPTGGVKLFTA